MKDKKYSIKDNIFNVLYGIGNDLQYYFKKKDGSYDLSMSKLFSNVCEDEVYCCISCYKNLSKNTIPNFSLANRFDFGEIPEELKDLNILEQRIISIYNCISTVCKLENHTDAQSCTYGGIAHLINDVASWAKILPRHPSQVELCNILVPKPKSDKYKGALYL